MKKVFFTFAIILISSIAGFAQKNEPKPTPKPNPPVIVVPPKPAPTPKPEKPSFVLKEFSITRERNEID